MFSSEHLNNILKDVMARLNTDAPSNTPNKGGNNSGASGNKISITPSQALVIGGILGGVLEVTSVLVGRDQTVEILLSGSLKQKTELEKMLDQIGNMPFDEVVKAMLGRL